MRHLQQLPHEILIVSDRDNKKLETIHETATGQSAKKEA